MVFLSSRISPSDVHGDLLGKVAAGDGGRHLGDVADLARQISGHEIHAVGKVGPGPGDALDLRLAAELSFRTHLAGNTSHFAREGIELVHHRIDGVLELEDLASNVDRDLLGKVALGDRGRHLGDVADLRGQIAAHEVHVVGEVLPRAGDTFDLRLAAELSFRTHFAGDACHFARERIELVHHGIDGVLEFEDLAFHVDGDLLGKVAARDCSRHLGDVADLAGEVRGHGVHIVGEVGPGARNARHLRLAAKLSFGTDLAGNARHFRGKAVQLVDHRVDGVLEFEDFALHVDGDLLGKVALGDGGRHFGDVAHLAGQIVGHEVDVVGEVLPRAGDAFDAGLAAKLSFRSHFAGDARHFRGKAVQLVDHRVDGVLELENLALHLDGDFLGKVAASNRGRHFGDVADLAGEVGRHRVHIVGEVLPRAGDALDLGLAAELSLGSDLARNARHFGSKAVQLVDHRVDDLADAKEFAAQRPAVDFDRHALGKVALGDGANDAGHFRSRLDHVLDEFVDRAHGGFPTAARILHAAALGDLAFLADDPGKPLEFLGHFFVERDDLVEEVGDLAIDAVNLFGEAHGEIAAAQGAQRTDELTAINEVARCLDVHVLLRWLTLPPPRLIQAQPPGCETPAYQKIWFMLPENLIPLRSNPQQLRHFGRHLPPGSPIADEFLRSRERVAGIEPARSAWEADRLPLHHTRELRRFGISTAPSQRPNSPIKTLGNAAQSRRNSRSRPPRVRSPRYAALRTIRPRCAAQDRHLLTGSRNWRHNLRP